MDGQQITLESQNGGEPETFTLRATVFIPAAERPQTKDLFTNLFVKNFPTKETTDEELRKMFEVFGPVTSCKMDETSKAFGFVCFEKPENAKSALDHFNKIEGGLLITKALPKSERARQLRLQTLQFMKDLAR
jgi:polyadenylate-binding protein